MNTTSTGDRLQGERASAIAVQVSASAGNVAQCYRTPPASLPPAGDTMRDHAVELARNGFRVFKLLVSGKTPAVDDWPTVASSDPETVHSMWTCAVSGESLDNNIGIATGRGRAVLDIDAKGPRNGFPTLATLEDMGLVTSGAPRVRTPSGGLHVYFSYPADLYVGNRVEAWAGIDIRGDRGFVVAPPSALPNGRYRWLAKGESHA